MKVKNEYMDFAKNIARRNKVRLDVTLDAIEQETDGFFYWIMRQMLWKIEGCKPAKSHNQIELSAGVINEDNVLVTYGSVGQYWADRRLKPNEFFDVMKNVSELLNSFPNYRATYLHSDESPVARLVVFLDV